MEGHVQPGEAALLRRAGEAEQTAPRALPRLQIQTQAQAHLHCGGTEAEGRRVQGHDEEPPAGAESHLRTQVETNTSDMHHINRLFISLISACATLFHFVDNSCNSESSFYSSFLKTQTTKQ